PGRHPTAGCPLTPGVAQGPRPVACLVALKLAREARPGPYSESVAVLWPTASRRPGTPLAGIRVRALGSAARKLDAWASSPCSAGPRAMWLTRPSAWGLFPRGPGGFPSSLAPAPEEEDAYASRLLKPAPAMRE